MRGVGKTVLLSAMRSHAIKAGWATGMIEARPGTSLRAPIAQALHGAVREISPRARKARFRQVLAVLKAFSLSARADGAWQLEIDVEAARGRADSGDFEVDVTELFSDAADLAAGLGTGVAVFVDEMQDVLRADLLGLCGACHQISQTERPLLLVGAGLPTLPAVLSAARSYAERLFSYVEIDKLDPQAADRALVAPAAREGVAFEPDALAAIAALADRYPYFIQAYGQAAWNAAPASPITAADVAAGRPAADRELALGFFGGRYKRATPREREYLHAMADLGDGPVLTTAVARRLGRPLSSLSPIRDGLIRKTLVYSPQRGELAFTVPHFAAYLRRQEPEQPDRKPRSPRRRAAASG